jgi:hypothetical protein
MNERIKQLADQALKECDDAKERGIDQYSKRFAELIVKACADAADMAQDAGCKYAGDYVAEQMGYGEEHGVTAWRTK